MYFWISGEHDREVDNETLTFKSKAVGVGIHHPQFFYRLSTGEIKYDIGLITLETPVDFSNKSFSHIR